MQKKWVNLLFAVIFIGACSGSSKQTDSIIMQTPATTGYKYLMQKGELDFDSLKGKRVVLGFFSDKHPRVKDMLAVLTQLATHEVDYNYKVLLVNLESNRENEVARFLKTQNIQLSVINDTTALTLATRFKIENDLAIAVLNTKLEPLFYIKKYIFGSSAEESAYVLAQLENSLGIQSGSKTLPQLGVWPQIPNFRTKTLKGEWVDNASFKGVPWLLFVFSPKCPHCQHMIEFLKTKLLPELSPLGLKVLGVSVLPLEGETLAVLESLKLPFEVVDDKNRQMRTQFVPASEGGVPLTFFINKSAQIQFVENGFNDIIEPLMTMRARAIVGVANPPLLSDKHYNGDESCTVCHQAQATSWSLTPHAHAWQTLVMKGEEKNPECVGCHSVGFNTEQGFKPVTLRNGKTVVMAPPLLQDVQCESCHGLGGPHVTTQNMLEPKTLEATCLTCHTQKFSLHFDFNERLKKVNHSDKDVVSQLSLQDRQALLKKVSKTPQQLFGEEAQYVGQGACLACHTQIHEGWQNSAHANAFATLEKAGKADDATCLRCHTTGFGSVSCFLAHVDDKNFKDVGCESCHGPGSIHIQSKQAKDIRGLGDDCPFCVVEQICLSCHDTQNDKDFNIHKALDVIRAQHGLKAKEVAH